ncbi:centromere protein T isoform X2 [Hyla sarda]|uniref:centromere protein T isoform X2 n=1 Tax=Hyla sarda TaxID=327740 RepID=UPI0024C2C763|nr:centromere protein T isoform X2 [Hyla sarda]
MEHSLEDNLTTRSMLRGILATEPVRAAVKHPSQKSGYRRSSTSYFRQDENSSSPSINLRSKMKNKVRRSLRKSAVETSALKRNVEPNSKTKLKSAKKGSFPIMEDIDKITPRTLLKKIIQNEDEVSIIVSQRSKAVGDDDDDKKQENSPAAQSSSVGNINLSLPDLQDTEEIKVFRKSRKKRKMRVSEFEREVDERLPKNKDNYNISHKSFDPSLSATSSKMSRLIDDKLEVSAAPESTFKRGLLRRPNKICLVSLGDFEQGVEDKYQLLKGSQECFIETEEDKSDSSSNELAQMNTELYAQSLHKDSNANKSERKQRGASKLFVSTFNERREAENLLETETRKLNASNPPIFNVQTPKENTNRDQGGSDEWKANVDREESDVVGDSIEDDVVGDSIEGDVVDDRPEGDVVEDSDEGDAADVIGKGGAAHDSGEGEVAEDSDEGDDSDDSGEGDAADVIGKGGAAHDSGEGEVAEDSDEGDDSDDSGEGDAADVLGKGDAAHDSGEGNIVEDSDESGDADDSGEGGDSDDSGEGDAADVLGKGDAAHESGEGDVGDAADIYGGDAPEDSGEGAAGFIHTKDKVGVSLMDVESNLQQNKSSLTKSNRKSMGITEYFHKMRHTRPSERNSMQTAESIRVHTVSVSRPEESPESSESSEDENVDLAQSAINLGITKKKENNQLMLSVLPETPAYMKSTRFVSTGKPAVSKKIQRTKTTKPKKQQTVLPTSHIKQIFSHHAQVRVSREAMADVDKCLELYVNQLAVDLSAYTAHANRKTVTRADMELLMKRQRLVTDTTSLNVLIEKHLPLDCRRLLIPCAMSGNKVFPKM